MKKLIASVKAYIARPAVKKQIGRAARLFAFALVAALVPLVKGHALTAKAVEAAVVAAAEVVYRSFVAS